MQAAPQVCLEEEAEKIDGELLEEYQEQEAAATASPAWTR